VAGGANGSVYIWDAISGRLDGKLEDQHNTAICVVTWRPMEA